MTAPTRQFRQHHAVEAPRIDRASFRTAWRVKTRLDQLREDGIIEPHEWAMAVRLRDAVETVARQGIRAAPTEYLPSGAKPNFGIAASASNFCRAIKEHLGPVGYAILTACVVDDLAWAELGRRMKLDPRTARAHTVVLIKMLGKKPLDTP